MCLYVLIPKAKFKMSRSSEKEVFKKIFKPELQVPFQPKLFHDSQFKDARSRYPTDWSYF